MKTFVVDKVPVELSKDGFGNIKIRMADVIRSISSALPIDVDMTFYGQAGGDEFFHLLTRPGKHVKVTIEVEEDLP